MNSNDHHKVLRINSIVDSPSAIESMHNLEKYKLLAVARSDNTIEIWSTNSWVQLIKIFGDKKNSIRRVFLYKKEDSLNLFDNLRLFTVGLNGYLIEWSLLNLQPKIFYQNPGGCIWDVDFIPEKKLCLLACDDGSVRAIKIKKTEFILEKQFSKTDSRILSIKSSTNLEIFYTGLSNGTILKWDFRSGQVQETFNISSKKVTQKQTESLMIWTLSELGNKYLFSGDSKGNLKVWDTNFGVLIKEFKEHEADILTSCANSNSNTVYFSGSDSLVCCIQLIDDEWVLTSKFRGQSHDVNSICLLSDDYLLSGGFTTDVCIYKLVDSRFVEKYDKKVPTNVKRHISGFEQKIKIYPALYEDNILILHRKLDKLNLWSFNETHQDKVLLLAEINKKNESHIISANISRLGKYFAYSDSVNTVLFKYDYDNNEIKKLKTFKGVSSKYLNFTNDENKLITLDGINQRINIYNIKTEITESISISALQKNESILSCDYFEEDNNPLLAFSTLNKNIMLVNINKKTVVNTLPSSDNFTTQIKFLNKNTLITVGEDNKFLLIDINGQSFNEWTKKNINNFPKNYLRWYNKIMGVACDFNDSNLFLLYTDYNYIKILLDKEIPDNSVVTRDKLEKIRNADWGKQIKEYHKGIFNECYKNMKNTEIEKEIFDEEENKNNFENQNFKITSRFSSILFMDYLKYENSKNSQKEKVLLVVENDWNKILKEFPDTVSKFNYGY